jgi:hypothetical protein
MFKQNFLVICMIVFGGFAVQAQTQYSYYFDNDINLVKKSHAVFVGVGEYGNGLFELKVFDKKSKKLLILEHFTDSSLQLSNGLFASFLPNGNKNWEGNYLMGKRDGLWKEWNWTGQVIDSSLFKDGTKIGETAYSYYPSGKLMSKEVSSGKDSIVASIFFDEKGKEITPNFKEDTDKVFTKVEVEASFPGGLQAWARYISRAIQSHIDEFKKSDYGTCIIRFIVDTKGEVHNVLVMNGCGIHLAKIGAEAIKNGPKWIPAQQNGKLVSAYRLQPITLQNPDN